MKSETFFWKIAIWEDLRLDTKTTIASLKKIEMKSSRHLVSKRSQALKVQLKSRIHCKIFWWGESSMCEGLTKGENGPTPSNCKRNRAQRIYRLAGHHDHIQFFYKWLNFYAETKKSSASWRLSKGLLLGPLSKTFLCAFQTSCGYYKRCFESLQA